MAVRLVRHCLKVQDFSDLHAFYGNLLGMQLFESETATLFGYDAKCLLAFHDGATQPYTPHDHGLYWKFGITLRDLDAAVSFLRTNGYPVSEPHQFRDIGYMSHLKDPNGLTIELLQQGFVGNAQPVGAGHAIGAQATLAHLTLRVTDIAAARDYCEERLGLQLISIQPVTDLGFSLYFFSGSDDTPPYEDLKSVDNRECLWSRPDMLLELQHLYDSSITIRTPNMGAAGFSGLSHQSNKADSMTTVSPGQLWQTNGRDRQDPS